MTVTSLPHAVYRSLIDAVRRLGRLVHGWYAAFGLVLALALGLALAGIWLFAWLAGDVIQGTTRALDERVLIWMDAHATPVRDRIALQITSVGNGAVVVTITLFISLFLWVLRYRLAAMLLVIAIAGADLANRVLKAVFERPRPELFVPETPFARPLSASFPSGHATAAMALYLMLAFLLSRLGGRGWFRVVVIVLASTLVIAIGVSRMYLGVHYPSDVIGGYLIGFIWVTFCILGFEAVEAGRGRGIREDRNLPHPPPREREAAAESRAAREGGA